MTGDERQRFEVGNVRFQADRLLNVLFYSLNTGNA